MKNTFRLLTANLLIIAFTISILPCGPDYITPIYDKRKSPETPFTNFAAGKLGIIKPTYNRSVLFAAYRYINGGSFNAAEQKGLIEVWNAEFNNEDYIDDDVNDALKKWIETRKSVVGKEEKTPEIYVERESGGYDFFPNCTKSAFETATETLKSRSASYGSDDKDVKDWIAAQDTVFSNCAEGKQMPLEAGAGSPEWLQKDRSYQMAAAAFYSLDYENAKRRFSEIAQDGQSPWQETADYLVGRTLIRQASLSKSETASNNYYHEAENYLYRVSVSGNKYADSAENLLGMVKFRIHPEQRLQELAQSLSYQNSGDNFRQQLIDYTWLMDKFQKQGLEKEEKRIEEEKTKAEPTNLNSDGEPKYNSNIVDYDQIREQEFKDYQENGMLSLAVSSEDYTQTWKFKVKADATDAETIAAAELAVGQPLTEKQKTAAIENRKFIYQNLFDWSRNNEYPGRYYGDVETSLSLLPPVVRADYLTEWLFTYQIQTNEAYLYSLDKFKQNKSDLWLMTAISKAQKSSAGLNDLLSAAEKVADSSPAFLTVAYHRARILMELKKDAEAKKLLDEILESTLEMPTSTRNQFLDLRVKYADTLDEFLKYALKKPFAYDYIGGGQTVDQIIEIEKKWYNPEYNEGTREVYEREVEQNNEKYRIWQDRRMIDERTAFVMNELFPMSLIIQTSKSPTLPHYLRERFIKVIFGRSLLTGDYATAEKYAVEYLKLEPEQTELVNEFLAAKPADKKYAIYYLILKNENMTPFIASGIGDEGGQYTFSTRWWCEPYSEYYGDDMEGSIPAAAFPRPTFLKKAQADAAQVEMKRIKALGDAPKYLGNNVLEWAKLRPKDKRIPESLYIVYESNGWDKYGCGNDEELRKAAANLLKTKYPDSEWTAKLEPEEEEQ